MLTEDGLSVRDEPRVWLSLASDETHSKSLSMGKPERQARELKRGLWVDPPPVPPSAWRGASARRDSFI